MTVAAVLLVKDEADVIDRTIRHLATQVDGILVMDNGSVDGTRDILATHERDGVVVYDDPEVGYYQDRKTTWLAQKALKGGFDWVIPCDADEWWYSPHGRLNTTLGELPAEVHFAHAVMHNHIGTGRDDPADANPFTRIGWRFRDQGAMTKVACRLSPDLRIDMGNHAAWKEGSIRSDWHHTAYDVVCLRHFPWRSEEQFLRKITNGSVAYHAAPDLDPTYGEHWKAFGLPDAPDFEARVRAWFWEWGYRENPREVGDLIFDPAPSGG